MSGRVKVATVRGDPLHERGEDEDVGTDLRLLPAALSAWVVTGLSLGLPAGWRLGAAGLLLVAAAALVALLRRAGRPGTAAAARPGAAAAALVLGAVALCLAAAGLHAGLRDTGPVRALARDGAVVRVEALVASDPRVLPSPSPAGQQLVLVRLDLREVVGRGQRSRVRTRVLVFADPAWLGLHWGERIAARGRLAPADPGDDVAATMDARGPPSVLLAASDAGLAAERLRAGLRTAVTGLDPDPRGLLPGLVVGDTSLQPPDLVDDMKATGLTHLSAVSGTNVTIVCVLALSLCRLLGLGRRVRLVGAGVVLVGFVVLARPEPSVLRAAVMGMIGLLAAAGTRRRAGVPALSAAVLGLIVIDPWLSRSYGFALSVLATLGLLLLARRWTTALARWMPVPVAAALAIPLAAQAVCGPVVVLLSAQVSLVSLPANALVAPLVAPATVLGLAAALLSVVSPAAAHLAAVAAGWPCSLMTTVARRLADVPGGQVGWPDGASGAVALAAVTAVTVLAGPWALRCALRRPGVGLGCAVLVAALLAPLPGASTVWPPAGWVAVACDVGQGDALVLRGGSGHTVLVDAGPSPDEVDRCLRRLGVETLDAVVLTHFHADHVDGLPGVLEGRRVAALLVTITDDPADGAATVRSQAAQAGVPVRSTRAGERVELGDLTWDVVWPERVLQDGSVPNNSSIVMDVRVAGVRLLLAGDIEPAAARVIAQRARLRDPQVDVLKVAHHGSAKQDPELVAALSPALALVSVGAVNDYGHPAPATLRLLDDVGARVGRTDLSGDLAVVRVPGGVQLITSGPRRHTATTSTGGGD